MHKTVSSARGAARGRPRHFHQRPRQQRYQQQQQQPRPTHFLALPLHHHPTLRNRVASFQNALLNGVSPIAGLDQSIVIDPRRLHLTLGVMALGGEDEQSATTSATTTTTTITKTVEGALQLLQSLQPSIAELLQGRTSVKVRLDMMDILKPENSGGDSLGAHVLFLGPSLRPEDEEGMRLQAVCNLVNQAFREAGFITETRPLKLHCTILNTSYRRPAKPRLPFSYSDILASSASQSILSNANESIPPSQTPRGIDFGVFDVKRVELWEMGSHGPNNEYISCGGLEFLT